MLKEKTIRFEFLRNIHTFLTAHQLQIKIILKLEYSQWPRCASSVDELQKEIKIYDSFLFH